MGTKRTPRHLPARHPHFTTWRTPLVIAAALTLGLLARIWLLGLSPQFGYFGDHDDYVRWGILANDRGVTSLYREPPPRHPAVGIAADGRRYVFERPYDRILNYPPLAAYLLWLQGRAHKALDGERYVNTRLAHTVYSTVGMACDLLVAMGCLTLVGGACGAQAGARAFAAAFLLPPLALDSALWGQTDSWLLAPAVWMVHAMQEGRWRRAGLLWGVAMGLKTQGVLLAGVWLPALLLERPRHRVAQGMLVAGGVLSVSALPFWLTSGGSWFYYAFVDNILNQYPDTTLYAFNLWYVDLLLNGTKDATALLLGLTRDRWGQLLAAASVAVGYTLLVRRWWSDPQRWTLLGGWVLLVAATLPTRVHERYIVFCLPFLICAAFRVRAAWWGVSGLVVAATFQITVHNWGSFLADRTVAEFEAFYHQQLHALPPDQRTQVKPLDEQLEEFWAVRMVDLPKEWGLVALALTSTIWVLVALGRHGGRLPRGP